MNVLRNMLKGITGEYEIGRTLWASGGSAYIVAPLVFQGIDTFKNGHWDPMGFCTGYGAGLAAVLALGGFGVGAKDKAVATAKATVVDSALPKQVEVINTPENPVPTSQEDKL